MDLDRIWLEFDKSLNAEANKKPDDMEEIEEVDDDELVDIDDSSDSDFRNGRLKWMSWDL